jgi:formate hydrogenlyase transcriptional activator
MPFASAAAASADSLERYRALLEISDVTLRCRNLGELFHQLAECLHRVVTFDSVAVGLLDGHKTSLRLALFESRIPQKVDVGFTVPLDAVPGGWVVEHQQPYMWTANDADSGFHQHHRDVLLLSGLKASFHLPLSTSRSHLGELVFVFKEIVELNETERQFMRLVANQVATAIENATSFEQVQRAQSEVERKNEQLKVLLELTNNLISSLELRDLLRAVASGVRRVVQSACVSVFLPNAERTHLVVEALDFPESYGFLREGFVVPIEGSLAGRAFTTASTIVTYYTEREKYAPVVQRIVVEEGLKSGGFAPIVSRGRTLGFSALAGGKSDISILTMWSSSVM